MIIFKLILFTLFISGSRCKHPDKVYCVNEGCTEPISKAKTLLNYNSVDRDLISFRGNSEALVYMKSAGTNPDLWFVSINGKSGFASTKFLREQKVFVKNPEIIVQYEPKSQVDVQPDKVQQAHEVFEGTTIYTTEAAVNNAEHDATTDAPVISSDELTPVLENKEETQNDNVDNSENVVSQDNAEQPVENPNVSSQEQSDVDTSTQNQVQEQLEKEDNVENNEENQNEELSVDSAPDSNEDTKSKEKEINNMQQIELPKVLPPDVIAQQLLSTISGTLNSEPLLEVPDKKEYKSLTEPEQTDAEQNNVSTSNTNVENVQVVAEDSSESNLPNGDSNPVIAPVEEQDQQNLPTLDENTSQPISEESNEAVNVKGAQSEENIMPPADLMPVINEPLPTNLPEPQVTEKQPKIPAEIPPESLSPPPPSETIPPLPPILDTNPTQLPVTTETIPALFPQAAQTIPTPETIPVPGDLINEPPPENQNVQEREPSFSEAFTTTPAPYYSSEETITQETSTESAPTQDSYASLYEHVDNTQTSSSEQLQEDTSTVTEATVLDENTEGFFSNMYSTIADMLPTTTDTPPIYNNEEYPTYESEKSEKSDSNEGFSFMKYIMSTYYSVMGTSEESKALFASVGETCYTDEYCDGTSNAGTNRLLTFLLTSASSVLLFTLGYYYIENRRQDGRLIGQINSLQRDLLFTTKECEILKEELSSTKSKLAGIEDSSFGMDDMVQSLKEEINELKATNERLRNSLDDNEKLLRVSENTAGELQNTLSEVENTLSELLAERANSEEQIVELNGKVQAFEEELISVSRDRDNFQLKYVSAESALEEFKKQKKQLEELNQLLADSKNTIELQKHEIDALKEAIKELKSGVPSNVDASSLIDHTEIKAKLSKALQEKKTFETKYEAEHKERSRLAEELQATQETLHTTSQNATEALTRLEVLGKYFQERESELLKELSAKESLYLSKQGESASTVEKIELLQQEAQRYKEKCDALTLELAEAESARRAALSAVEARAHAAWLEARAAKRDADAARDDAAALRRKLASLSAANTADGAVSPHHKVASPLDGVDNPVIPPPLPPMFLPPPLLPPLPRPPPLGRLPSPHPPRYGERRYTPDSRYSPESRYSPDSRYSPETVRYSPDSRYSPRSRREPYSPRSRRRSRSRERYEDTRGVRSRNGPADTETEYNSDSPTRDPRRRSRYSRHSGPSSGSGCSTESDK